MENLESWLDGESPHVFNVPLDLDEASRSGFGTFAPANQEDEKQDDAEDVEEDDGEFVSLHELRKNRISREG